MSAGAPRSVRSPVTVAGAAPGSHRLPSSRPPRRIPDRATVSPRSLRRGRPPVKRPADAGVGYAVAAMGTHYRGPEAERLALDAYVKLMRSAATVSARLAGGLRGGGLTVSQFGVLEALLHLGSMSQRELAGKILVSTGNLTTVLDHLEARGLVSRRRDPTDRRVKRVTLTRRGRDLVEAVLPGHVARIAQELAVLSTEEQATLGRLCRRLGLGADRDAGQTP